MRVEAATIEDSRAIAEVHVASWQSSYAGILSAEYLASLSVEKREASWRKGFQEGSPEVLVARSEIGVVGFVAFGACRDQGASLGCGEIWAIYLLPSSWSAGIGRELWFAASERLRALGFGSVTLWVLARNERAIKFYTRAGFTLESGSAKNLSPGGMQLQEVRLVFQNGA